MTRIVCISDTHTKHASIKEVPDGDIIIHSGDFTLTGKKKEVQIFTDWFSALPHQHKIIIAGNHELTLDADFYEQHWKRFHKNEYKKEDCEEVRKILTENEKIIYLQDTFVTINGLKIYGCPSQPAYNTGAFALSGESESVAKWSQIPEDTDILVTHGPPYGYGDMCDVNAGCHYLLDRITQIRPKYHICGHIHEGYGVTNNQHTTFVNASICDWDYYPGNKPIVFDL